MVRVENARSGTAEKAEPQIPHRLKSVRDDKNRGTTFAARPKPRPFKASAIEFSRCV